MAKTVKIKSKLRQNKNKALLVSTLSMLFSFIFFVSAILLFVKNDTHIAFPVSFLVIGAVLIIISLIGSKRYQIIKAGVKGEKSTLEILKKLPMGFTVISNPVIRENDREFELDFLVIGSEGVFIIETKNYSGTVCGAVSNTHWKQTKQLANGETAEKLVKNPVKQSERQLRKLKTLFKELDVNAYIYPVVYFANENVKLEYKMDEETPVFVAKNEGLLLDYITESDGKKTVNTFERSRLIKYFKNNDLKDNNDD